MPDRLDPSNQGKADGVLLADLTGWRPGRAQDVGFTGTEAQFAALEDRMDIIVSTSYWKEVSTQINFGVFNAAPERGPVDVSIKVRDFSPMDIYSQNVRKRAAIVNSVYLKIDVINESWKERDEKELLGNRDFTYGEARFHSFYPLLKLANP